MGWLFFRRMARIWMTSGLPGSVGGDGDLDGVVVGEGVVGPGSFAGALDLYHETGLPFACDVRLELEIADVLGCRVDEVKEFHKALVDAARENVN